MHGIIFNQLQKYVTTRLGAEAWSTLLAESGKRGTVYLPSQEYPDADIVSLVVTACKITGKPAAQLLEDFGSFLVPDLVKIYGAAIRPEWRTIDLIENAETSIHTVVRLKNPGAQPPKLTVRRDSPQSVEVTYASPRKMCAVAKGIARGIATHYREQLRVQEDTCMLAGAPTCKLRFSVP